MIMKSLSSIGQGGKCMVVTLNVRITVDSCSPRSIGDDNDSRINSFYWFTKIEIPS